MRDDYASHYELLGITPEDVHDRDKVQDKYLTKKLTLIWSLNTTSALLQSPQSMIRTIVTGTIEKLDDGSLDEKMICGDTQQAFRTLNTQFQHTALDLLRNQDGELLQSIEHENKSLGDDASDCDSDLERGRKNSTQVSFSDQDSERGGSLSRAESPSDQDSERDDSLSRAEMLDASDCDSDNERVRKNSIQENSSDQDSERDDSSSHLELRDEPSSDGDMIAEDPEMAAMENRIAANEFLTNPTKHLLANLFMTIKNNLARLEEAYRVVSDVKKEQAYRYRIFAPIAEVHPDFANAPSEILGLICDYIP